jgi:hypothetical protein
MLVCALPQVVISDSDDDLVITLSVLRAAARLISQQVAFKSGKNYTSYDCHGYTQYSTP